MYFTFTDYNLSVLQLITLPNLLLTFAGTLADSLLGPAAHGDLELSPSFLGSFVHTLNSYNIHLIFISGSWSPADPFLSLISTDPDMNTLVLGSETIYSPGAMSSFAQVLIGIMKRVRLGKGVVAAKRVYFGVGGGVDAFKRECSELGAVVSDVENHGIDVGGGEGGGVRRCLLEVQMF
jgi:protein-histidine N-methyltransferase